MAKDLEGLDARVVAVSVDPPVDNRAFQQAEHLPFPILSDPGGRIAARYGVVRGSVARRASFVFDPEGVVQHVDLDVRVSRHGGDLLRRLRELREARTGVSR